MNRKPAEVRAVRRVLRLADRHLVHAGDPLIAVAGWNYPKIRRCIRAAFRMGPVRRGRAS